MSAVLRRADGVRLGLEFLQEARKFVKNCPVCFLDLNCQGVGKANLSLMFDLATQEKLRLLARTLAKQKKKKKTLARPRH